MSGASASRPEPERLLTQLRTSDAGGVYKPNRLGRSLKHLLQVVGDFQQLGVAWFPSPTPPTRLPPRGGPCLTCLPRWLTLSAS